MTEGVELVRDLRDGAETISRLPVALGAFVCQHVASGDRPACRINIDAGDVSAVCEDGTCFDDKPDLTALYRVLHFAPDVGALGPARNGWYFVRETPTSPWMALAPGENTPIPAEAARQRRH